ncbi:MAG: hypothetical protein K8R46_06500 [Pirellulales bacterium]|nr:hypothetical protein [Pirellulales bacterium]
MPLLACPAVQGKNPGKTLLDKPAVAPKIPKTDFFNGLLTPALDGSCADTGHSSIAKAIVYRFRLRQTTANGLKRSTQLITKTGLATRLFDGPWQNHGVSAKMSFLNFRM